MTVRWVETRPMPEGRRDISTLLERLASVRKLATAAGALVAFSAPAVACPYCSLSQGAETLVFIAAFLLIPYVIVTAVMFWMRRVLASEHEA